jgi:hypothetical protein
MLLFLFTGHLVVSVEFFEPAQYWNEALPLGSGRLGAMVYGGVQSELVQLNGKRSNIIAISLQTYGDMYTNTL